MSRPRFRVAPTRRPRRFVPRVDELDARTVPAVVATFTPGNGVLTVTGDSLNNTIAVSRDAAGRLLVNGGAVAVVGGAPTVANTALIQVFGQGGNDAIALNPTSRVFRPAQVFGGEGNDTIVGGSGNDQLFGDSGNDLLFGQAGADSLFGGIGNDTLTGGTGDDAALGEIGDDRLVWNSGDGSDLNEGGDGADVVVVHGGAEAETFAVTTAANATRVRFDRTDPAPFTLDIGTTENLVVRANGGNDQFSAGGNLAPLIQLTVSGGAGNDRLLGGNGNDRLFGDGGNDFLDGDVGNDVIDLGAGNDLAAWDPGDGSDRIEGQGGLDALVMSGSIIDEHITLSAVNGRLRLTRAEANVALDVHGVEAVTFNAFGGEDTVTVNDLAGAGVARVNLDLGGSIGGAGDGLTDRVEINGTDVANTLTASGSAGSFVVQGVHTVVAVRGSEGALDQLTVNGNGGNDTISTAGLSAGVVGLVAHGGSGNDKLFGSAGADSLIGGDGNDLVDGTAGADGAQLGTGDDTFVWNPGDGNDRIEGDDGTDALRVNGSAASEAFLVSSNGSKLIVVRDVGNVLLDIGTVERVDVNALGGSDNVTVNDQSTTAVDAVNINLGVGGLSDGAADAVVINGTNASETINVSSPKGGGVAVSASGARVLITRPDAARDRLTVNLFDGLDQANASGLAAGVIRLTLDGGADEDVLIGSPGRDDVIGGPGIDAIVLGAGADTFAWSPGDGSDFVEGGAGPDALTFTGDALNERIDLTANSGHLRLTRDAGDVTLDVTGVEAVTVNPRGGLDTVVVNDLTGTHVTRVDVNLATGALGDGFADSVIVVGTGGADGFAVAGRPGGVIVAGPAARVRITGAEAANDGLTVSAFGGNDMVNASNLPAGRIKLTIDGGTGTDLLVGSAGNDTLFGGDGNDTLTGGAGTDFLIGGAGTDVLNASGNDLALQ